MTKPTQGNNKVEESAPSPPLTGDAALAATEILRGVQRLLFDHGIASIAEFALANGRRADVCGIATSGDIWIVEIKSSISDFRSDQKWPEYREYCDRLFFGVAPSFPADILPPDTGLILADRFGGEIIRDAPEQRLASARRKAVTLQFARAAALRAQMLRDPQKPGT